MQDTVQECIVFNRTGWKQALLFGHLGNGGAVDRAGFGWYGRLISKARKPAGGRRTSKEVRDLILQMIAENPSWGAPASMESFSCSVLVSPKERFLAG